MTELMDRKATERVDVEAVFKAINMGRWQRIRRALDVTTDEVVADNFLMLLVVAHEWDKQEHHGKDRWEEFNALTFEQVVEFLGLQDELEQAQNAAESGD